MPMGKVRNIREPRPWILTDYVLDQIPAQLVTIATTSPFGHEGVLGYLNHTLNLILDRLGEEITGERGERILISTQGRWEAPWVLLYGMGPREELSLEIMEKELLKLNEALRALNMEPVAFLLPGYSPYRWGSPVESAQLLVDTISRPGLIVNPYREILHKIHYRVKGYFNYMLRDQPKPSMAK